MTLLVEYGMINPPICIISLLSNFSRKIDEYFLFRLHTICLFDLLTSIMQEVYEQQKELILLGERIVLATLGFDLNLHHPYKPLVEAIKKFKVDQNGLAQVACNFVNDGYEGLLALFI